MARASLCTVALAAALLPGATALRSKAQAEQPSRKYRQELGNLQDMQYFGNMSIGGQPLKAILDTGSFEILVFSVGCPTCGIANKYNERASQTFVRGTASRVHSYGSGSCTAKDGFDTVSVGTVVAKKQPIWVAQMCEIPLLSQASFNAIAGLGPPGQPAYTAQHVLDQLGEMEQHFKSNGEEVPENLEQQRQEYERDLALAQSKSELLDTMGVSVFSTCLGKKPNSEGYLIWNDDTRAGQPGVTQLPVQGNITWSIKVEGMSLHGHGEDTLVEGCEKRGCGAIVDTGTSLFAFPSNIYRSIADSIRNLGIPLDCSDLAPFPDLELTVNGHKLRFPPSTYLGSYYGQMSDEASGFIRTEKLGGAEHSTPCELLIMDLGPPQQTALGPMVILGMPFFREYYTSFDLGGGRGQRSLFVSKATETCEAGVGNLVSESRAEESFGYKPRRVDVSAVRVPHWAKPSKGAREL